MTAMELSLKGKVALVTGGGRGLGAACVRGLHAAGAEVIAVARSGDQLAELARQCAGLQTWCEDVTGDAFLARLRALTRLDVLVNNAGFNDPQPMLEMSTESLDNMLNLNVRSVYLASQAALSVMQRTGGSVVNMSSQMGHVGSPKRTVYCMTKHAVEGLTKAMAVEVASLGVRVNSIAPTFVETELTRSMLADAAFAEFVEQMIPMGRLATEEDVANAVVYLSSPAAGMITGHSLVVDGGWTAQ